MSGREGATYEAVACEHCGKHELWTAESFTSLGKNWRALRCYDCGKLTYVREIPGMGFHLRKVGKNRTAGGSRATGRALTFRQQALLGWATSDGAVRVDVPNSLVDWRRTARSMERSGWLRSIGTDEYEPTDAGRRRWKEHLIAIARKS